MPYESIMSTGNAHIVEPRTILKPFSTQPLKDGAAMIIVELKWFASRIRIHITLPSETWREVRGWCPECPMCPIVFYWLVETKTSQRKRVIALATRVATALQVHRKAQLEARLKAGEKWTDQGFVFTTRTGAPHCRLAPPL